MDDRTIEIVRQDESETLDRLCGRLCGTDPQPYAQDGDWSLYLRRELRDRGYGTAMTTEDGKVRALAWPQVDDSDAQFRVRAVHEIETVAWARVGALIWCYGQREAEGGES